MNLSTSAIVGSRANGCELGSGTGFAGPRGPSCAHVNDSISRRGRNCHDSNAPNRNCCWALRGARSVPLRRPVRREWCGGSTARIATAMPTFSIRRSFYEGSTDETCFLGTKNDVPHFLHFAGRPRLASGKTIIVWHLGHKMPTRGPRRSKGVGGGVAASEFVCFGCDVFIDCDVGIGCGGLDRRRAGVLRLTFRRAATFCSQR